MNSRFGPEPVKSTPQRHKPPQSNPNPSRTLAQGRETEISYYTDGYRRGRRSRSVTPERSPEPYHSSSAQDLSPKAPAGIPRRHLTLAEKKRMEWDTQRGKT
mgnify:CR=1 FL=1